MRSTRLLGSLGLRASPPLWWRSCCRSGWRSSPFTSAFTSGRRPPLRGGRVNARRHSVLIGQIDCWSWGLVPSRVSRTRACRRRCCFSRFLLSIGPRVARRRTLWVCLRHLLSRVSLLRRHLIHSNESVHFVCSFAPATGPCRREIGNSHTACNQRSPRACPADVEHLKSFLWRTLFSLHSSITSLLLYPWLFLCWSFGRTSASTSRLVPLWDRRSRGRGRGRLWPLGRGLLANGGPLRSLASSRRRTVNMKPISINCGAVVGTAVRRRSIQPTTAFVFPSAILLGSRRSLLSGRSRNIAVVVLELGRDRLFALGITVQYLS